MLWRATQSQVLEHDEESKCNTVVRNFRNKERKTMKQKHKIGDIVTLLDWHRDDPEFQDGGTLDEIGEIIEFVPEVNSYKIWVEPRRYNEPTNWIVHDDDIATYDGSKKRQPLFLQDYRVPIKKINRLLDPRFGCDHCQFS